MTTSSELSKFIGHKVKAYRNLNKPSFFSVKAKGHDGREVVQGYSQIVVLADVTFTGGHSAAQKKIQNGEARSVHAYAVGTLVGLERLNNCIVVEVTYRPKERAGFFEVHSGREVVAADLCMMMDSKMYCVSPR